jgi:hypothetical protein
MTKETEAVPLMPETTGYHTSSIAKALKTNVSLTNIRDTSLVTPSLLTCQVAQSLYCGTPWKSLVSDSRALEYRQMEDRRSSIGVLRRIIITPGKKYETKLMAEPLVRQLLPDGVVSLTRGRFPPDDQFERSDHGIAGTTERSMDPSVRSSWVHRCSDTEDDYFITRNQEFLSKVATETFGMECRTVNLQILRYDVGDFFDVHADRCTDPRHHVGTLLLLPPLSASIYSGGELLVANDQGGSLAVQKVHTENWAMVMMGFRQHRVQKVTCGRRYVLKMEVRTIHPLSEPHAPMSTSLVMGGAFGSGGSRRPHGQRFALD